VRFLLGILFACHSLWGGVGGSLSGRVADPHNLPVSGAKVTATNTATNLRQTVTTGPNGLYAFPDLAVGAYDVEVQSNGFRTYRAAHLVVDTNSALSVAKRSRWRPPRSMSKPWTRSWAKWCRGPRSSPFP
jgi:hypothetical protein